MLNKYQSCESTYYNTYNSYIINHITGDLKIILDVGCAAGALGKKLRDLNKAGYLIGIELFEDAAHIAEKYYDQVLIGDIEEIDLELKSNVDYAICGDIIEHVKDPWHVLGKINKCLNRNGKILITIPNLRYWKVVKKLTINGEFDYTNAGILDVTHLRFFTKNSFEKILAQTSYKLELAKYIIYGGKKNLFNKISLRLFEPFLASQILFVASKKE